MRTSFPYMTLAKCIGADYGRVLSIVEKLDSGETVGEDPFLYNVRLVWQDEQERRSAVSCLVGDTKSA